MNHRVFEDDLYRQLQSLPLDEHVRQSCMSEASKIAQELADFVDALAAAGVKVEVKIELRKE